jgi:heme exporter protein CcmD
MDALFLGKYAVYVGGAYAVSAVSLLLLVAGSLRHAARWRRRYEELTRK